MITGILPRTICHRTARDARILLKISVFCINIEKMNNRSVHVEKTGKNCGSTKAFRFLCKS